MKNLFTIVCLFLILSAKAQYEQPQTMGGVNTLVSMSKLKADSVVYLPYRDTTFRAPSRGGAIVYRPADKNIYKWDGQHWSPIGSGNVDSLYKRNDSLLFKKGGTEYFFAKTGVSTIVMPGGFTVNRSRDSVYITTQLSGILYADGLNVNAVTIQSPLLFSGGVLSMAAADVSTDGYLKHTDWVKFNSSLTTTRTINTINSLTGGGSLGSDRTLSLVNDKSNPGNNQYYGTDTIGTRGWFAIPNTGMNSIGLSMPTGFTVTGSPLTSNGSINVTSSLSGLLYGTGSGFNAATINAPLQFNSGVLNLPKATPSADGYLGAQDFSNFTSAYNRKVVNFQITGNTTKTITLFYQDGTQSSQSFTDNEAPDNTGVTNINGITGSVQTLSTGTSGTDFNISSTGSTHNFNIPTASATNRGLIAPTDWTIFNNKLGVSDSSTFLNPYIHSAGYGLIKTGKSLGVDTSKIATIWKLDSLHSLIGTGGSGVNFTPTGSIVLDATNHLSLKGDSTTVKGKKLYVREGYNGYFMPTIPFINTNPVREIYLFIAPQTADM
jgi:hypothetical protein